MKELTIFVLALFLSISISFAQNTHPVGILFTSQEQIDNFHQNLPQFANLNGSIIISGAEITDLSGLEGLVSISGDLEIEFCENLTSLNGLENLEAIANPAALDCFRGLDELGWCFPEWKSAP